jgi:hypothetical protein
VSLGEITKQIAKQALGEQVKEALGTAPGATAEAPETPAAVIFAQLNAMQNALKPEQELVVHCGLGPDRIRVVEIFAPSAQVLILTGFDAQQNITRVIASASSLQLTCKPSTVAPGGKATRLRLVTPRPKAD